MDFIGFVFTAIAVGATVLNVRQKIEGFIGLFIANCYFCYRGFTLKEYPQVTLFAIYILLAIAGYYSWTKKGHKSNILTYIGGLINERKSRSTI